MQYEFPRIEYLDEVRAAIQGVDGFIIAERDWGYVCNYIKISPDSFPPVHTAGGSAKMRAESTRNKAIRRECRGIIFCPKSLRITRRPLHKFWNVNEREETLLENLDFSRPHKVYTKLDGSMIAPFEVAYKSGLIRWGTKMGAGTDVAMAAEVFVADNSRYQRFAEWCIQEDITPIFEFTSPGVHKIVVDYDKPELTLLAARHMLSGHYFDLEQDIRVKVDEYSIPIVSSHDPVSNPKEFLHQIKLIEGSEGVVIAWQNDRVKAKGDWYVARHKAKDKILRENGLIELMFNEQLDDIKPVLSHEDRCKLEEFENSFWHGVHDTAVVWANTYKKVRKQYGNDRKNFALAKETANIDGNLRSAIFKAWDREEFDWREAVIEVIKKNLGSQNKVNDIRYLWGNIVWTYTTINGEA